MTPLRRFREKQRMTQKEMAKAIDASVSSVQRLERNSARIGGPLKRLIEVCNRHGISPKKEDV